MLRTLSDYSFIDVHYHANPDLYERRYTAHQIGQRYQVHQAAVVLKSHLGSTASQATLLQAMGYPVLGSVVLNDIGGGLDYRVVLRSLMEYRPLIESRLLVHLPTIVGRSHQSKLSRQLCFPNRYEITHKPLGLLDEHQRLKPEVFELIQLAANEPIVLSTGHASQEETYALVDAMANFPASRLMLNQPANPLTGFTADRLNDFSEAQHVYIEQTALTYLLGYQSKDDFKQVLTTLPQVIYSSDLGQTSQMDLDEFFATTESWFQDFELTSQQKEAVCKRNPMQMLAY